MSAGIMFTSIAPTTEAEAVEELQLPLGPSAVKVGVWDLQLRNRLDVCDRVQRLHARPAIPGIMYIGPATVIQARCHCKDAHIAPAQRERVGERDPEGSLPDARASTCRASSIGIHVGFGCTKGSTINSSNSEASGPAIS